MEAFAIISGGFFAYSRGVHSETPARTFSFIFPSGFFQKNVKYPDIRRFLKVPDEKIA